MERQVGEMVWRIVKIVDGKQLVGRKGVGGIIEGDKVPR